MFVYDDDVCDPDRAEPDYDQPNRNFVSRCATLKVCRGARFVLGNYKIRNTNRHQQEQCVKMNESAQNRAIGSGQRHEPISMIHR